MTKVQSDVLIGPIGQYVERIHVPDASRQMRLARAKLTEHDLDSMIDWIEGDSQQWIVSFLRLRAEAGIVDFQRRASADVAPGEIIEGLAPP